jgi:xanthine dehydrogenase YagR molybdenum-binding subunit
MRAGDWLVGYGMASVSFGWYGGACKASITIDREGEAVVRSAATDIGTGTYTIATQLAAELLDLPMSKVRVEIGDTDLPPAPQSGGSGLAAAFAAAIQDAAGNLLKSFADHGSGSYADVLARNGLDSLTAEGSVDLGADAAASRIAPAGAFAARFVEVRVDEELGRLRVSRIMSVVDGGRILNEKTARSQILGGTVMGIGMALFEDTIYDTGTGRIANATFGDYLIPVNADIPDLDVVFVGEPDTFNATGAKGVGEVGVVGVAAGIANAAYHATGRRIRSLPLTIEKLMRALDAT